MLHLFVCLFGGEVKHEIIHCPVGRIFLPLPFGALTLPLVLNAGLIVGSLLRMKNRSTFSRPTENFHKVGSGKNMYKKNEWLN